MTRRNLKKHISFLLAIALIVSCIPVTVYAANIGDTTTYTVGDASAVPGGTVEVTVNFANYIEGGLTYGYFQIDYDTNNLTLTKVACGKDFSECIVDGAYQGEVGKVMYNYNDWFSSFDNSGELAVLTFAVNEGAPAGDYKINLVKWSNETWFTDSNWRDPGVTPVINPGTITVTSGGSDSDDPSGTEPSFSGNNLEDGYIVYWDYGGDVTRESANQYFIQAKDGYVIDEIVVDNVLAQGDYHGKKSYTWSGAAPEHGLLITFAYTLTLDP